MRTGLGMLIAFGIGVACRYFSVPVPAPPTLFGVVLIACITAGYLFADRLFK
jgi:XapX domain-containing protein